MPDSKSIPLSFRLHQQRKPLLVLTLGGLLVYQLMTLQRGEHSDLALLTQGHLGYYLKMLLGYYYLFELVSLVVLVQLMQGYRRVCKLRTVQPTLKSVLGYQLIWLPFFLSSILVVGPLTNTLRYVVLFYPTYDWGAYFPEYVLTGRMYANYVLPCLLVGYGLVNGNLFLDYNDYQKRELAAVQRGGLAQASGLEPISPESAYLTHLEASDAEGEALLRVSEIWYIEVDKKQYLAYTAGQTYQLRRSLADLEACLSPHQFYRLNRSVLVNLAYLKNYSYWEHDKYIVRLKDDKTEFTMQRTRLKALKERLPMAESFVASRLA